jgi:hypothetical protein
MQSIFDAMRTTPDRIQIVDEGRYRCRLVQAARYHWTGWWLGTIPSGKRGESGQSYVPLVRERGVENSYGDNMTPKQLVAQLEDENFHTGADLVDKMRRVLHASHDLMNNTHCYNTPHWHAINHILYGSFDDEDWSDEEVADTQSAIDDLLERYK